MTRAVYVRPRDVAHLAGGTAGPPIDLAVDHDPDSEAGAELEVHEAARVAAPPEVALADRGQVRVVVDRHARSERVAQLRRKAGLRPVRQVRGMPKAPSRRVEHTWAADDRVDNALPADPGLLDGGAGLARR